MNDHLLIVCLVAVSVLATILLSRIYFQKKIKQLEFRLNEGRIESIRLQEMMKSRELQLQSGQQSLLQWETKIQKEFSLLAEGVLERKSRQFNDQQESKLNDLLNPLKDTIKTFKEEMNAKFTDEIKDKGSLKEEIAKLMSANQTISRQAQDLSQALKGSTKKQGDWGEGILDSILGFAGLQEGIHYTRQVEEKTEDSLRIRPDVQIKLPQNRHLIIDSKVSLTHYWEYCSCEDADLQQVLLQSLVRSMKIHIDSLNKKAYIDIIGTPDFLIMFVPVEPSYMVAMQHDPQLWQYAYSKKVLLISPTNLIPAMKMVSDMWQREDVNRNAQAIALQAGKLYDKLAGFIENFEKTGAQISAAGRAFENSRKQLVSGRGNIISHAEKLRALRLQTSKIIPKSISDEALLSDELASYTDDRLDSENQVETENLVETEIIDKASINDDDLYEGKDNLQE